MNTMQKAMHKLMLAKPDAMLSQVLRSDTLVRGISNECKGWCPRVSPYFHSASCCHYARARNEGMGRAIGDRTSTWQDFQNVDSAALFRRSKHITSTMSSETLPSKRTSPELLPNAKRCQSLRKAWWESYYNQSDLE